MDVYTTQPGTQVYTGYYLDCDAGKNGAKYGRYSGLCLETQNYPDAPNKVGSYIPKLSRHKTRQTGAFGSQ